MCEKEETIQKMCRLTKTNDSAEELVVPVLPSLPTNH